MKRTSEKSCCSSNNHFPKEIYSPHSNPGSYHKYIELHPYYDKKEAETFWCSYTLCLSCWLALWERCNHHVCYYNFQAKNALPIYECPHIIKHTTHLLPKHTQTQNTKNRVRETQRYLYFVFWQHGTWHVWWCHLLQFVDLLKFSKMKNISN